jgi:hypothetical protein
MSKSSLAAAVAVALAVASTAASAQSFAYKAGAQRYRLDQTVATSQTVQGMSQNATSSTAQFVSMELAPAAEGLGVTFVIDSVVVMPADSAAAASPAQAQAQTQAEDAAKALKGRKLAGTVSPLGKVQQLAVVDTVVPNAQQLANGFKAFLVPFPSPEVKAGLTWTDTTTNEFKNMSGLDGTTKGVMTYTVVGDTTVHGQRAWRVEQKGTLTMTGTGSAQGTDVSLAGTGEMTGLSVVAQDGVYLGGRMEQTQSLTVEVPAANMTIPITNKVTTRIEHVAP